jgi:S1-C subfamily serine protease
VAAERQLISAMSGIQGERRVMQVTVPIQPGDSGGSIVTETGFAIGIINLDRRHRAVFQSHRSDVGASVGPAQEVASRT